MKIAIFHAGNSGFFPRYYKAITAAIEKEGDEVALFAPNSGRNSRNKLPHQITWGTRLNWFIHHKLYQLTGIQDIFSICETIMLIHKLKKYRPDVIHFNVINDKIINIPMLVQFINRNEIPVVWTMHDCRAFTGQCPYFDEVKCNRWKTGCGQCPQCESWIDNTHATWKIRYKWHTHIKNLTIVTPSEWLANFVKESFFQNTPVQVIYNGVDTRGFSRKTNIDIQNIYHLQDKKIVLGCAINWESRKGMKYFERLAEMLPENYQIVLIGNIQEDKKQRMIQKGIICTGRTQTFDEMVTWYQTASVFCNPTLADNFPTTNIEALASGTPVVTFNTGGSPEAIDEHTGIVVEQGDVEALRNAIIEIAEHRNLYSYDNCIQQAQRFSNKQYNLYVQLYHEIANRKNSK